VIIATTISVNKVKIRLTDERWKHIVLLHPGLVDSQSVILSTVKNPDYVFAGGGGELLATSKIFGNHYIVVVYKETSKDGFTITAYETNDTKWLFKKKIIWSRVS